MAEHLNELIQFRITWFGGRSEEERAAILADRATWNEEPTKSERQAEMAATFGAADTDQDGKLTFAEYHDFMGKVKQNCDARNVPFIDRDEVPEDVQQKFYAYLVSKSDSDGITMAGFLAGAEEMSAAMQAAMQGQ